jgi:hypothetical protein
MKPVAWAIKSDNDFTEIGFDNDLLKEVEEMYAMEGWKYEVVPLYTAPRELSDEALNKAFDYYCQTDEGVLRFNYELRDEWKKEQLFRWKEAFKKASER